MTRKSYVIDACTLLNFYCRLEREDCLYKLFRNGIRAVEEVKYEVKYIADDGCREKILTDFDRGFLKVELLWEEDDDCRKMLGKHSHMLDSGELNSAALALSRGYIFLTDDKKAYANLLGSGIECRDSKWILKEAAKSGFLTRSEHKRLNDRLKQHSWDE